MTRIRFIMLSLLLPVNCITVSVHDYPPELISSKIVQKDTDKRNQIRKRLDAAVQMKEGNLLIEVDRVIANQNIAIDEVENTYLTKRSAFDPSGTWVKRIWLGFVSNEHTINWRGEFGTGYASGYIMGCIGSFGLQLPWAVGDWATLPLRSFDRTERRIERHDRIESEKIVSKENGPVLMFINKRPARILFPGRSIIPIQDLWREGFLLVDPGHLEMEILLQDTEGDWSKDFKLQITPSDLQKTSYFQRDLEQLRPLIAVAENGDQNIGDSRLIILHTALLNVAKEEARLNDLGTYFASMLLRQGTIKKIPKSNADLLPIDWYYSELLNCLQCWTPTGRYIIEFHVQALAGTAFNNIPVRLFTRDKKYLGASLMSPTLPLILHSQDIVKGRLIKFSLKSIDLED